jgi:hypothetical protein
MIDLPDSLVRFYEDGVDWAITPEKQAAERAYREAFRLAALEAATWPTPDADAIQQAWDERRQARANAEVLVPSAIYFNNPRLDSDQIAYAAGHEVEASRTRGKVHALEIASQCWDELENDGIPDAAVGPLVLRPWSELVQEWAQAEIEPTRISTPPRPEGCIPVEHRPLLDQLRETWEAAEPVPENLSPALPIKSVRQLFNENPDLRRPVIHGLLREGETMNVIASPKIGKSWLVTDLALAVATGRPWLDTFLTERGDVLIIDNELHRETSANRIPKVMQARRIPLHAVAEQVFIANVRGGLKDIFSLGTYFQQLQPGRFKLIVLDAFYRFMPKDTDENDNGTMSQVYNHLDGYAARLGCSFVLVHHSSKGNQSGKSITDVGAGAGTQSRATDTHLILRPHEEQDCVVIDAAVRSWPPIEPRVLRWTFPVWTPDDSLDATALRPERPRRKARTEEKARTERIKWDVDSFVETFVAAEPKPRLLIVSEAVAAGISEHRATQLLKHAEALGQVHRWNVGLNLPVRFAVRPQPDPTEGKPEGGGGNKNPPVPPGACSGHARGRVLL